MSSLFNSVWLIPLLPLLSAAATALIHPSRRKLISGLVIGAMACSCLLSSLVLLGVVIHAGEHNGGEPAGPFRHVVNFTWFPMADGGFNIGFIVDPLTAGMLFMVSFVGLLIFIYSTGYMAEDPRYSRFFNFLGLFAAAMLMLTISNNILLLFMSWEVVGLCSYLLIGFWYHKPAAAAAAKKAFMVTRVGDMGFFGGILLLMSGGGTLILYGGTSGSAGLLDQAMLERFAGLTVNLPLIGSAAFATVVSIALFIGAVGKSAQFPLHVWLPDAMEGPTAVSALIHAATMVAAGVFMIARMYPLLEVGAAPGGHGMSAAMGVVAMTGAFTALFAASIAVAQNDIKRVLAYSTVSQLGFMMIGLGVGGFVAGTLHLLLHAFFKALLFLGSGSVIHGCHGRQDMRQMGGLAKKMPATFWTYLFGTLALAGIPPFAGFWSKDEILLEAQQMFPLAYYMGTAAAFLTAFYMGRQIFMVFFGEQRDHSYHPHESPPSMVWPLRILALCALLLGFVGMPFLIGNPYHHFVAPERHALPPSFMVMGLSTALALAGAALAWLLYGRRGGLRQDQADPLREYLGGFYRVLENKYYIDEVYAATIARAASLCAAVFGWFDRTVIDGAIHLSGRAALALSHVNQWVDNFFINAGFDQACQGLRGGARWLRLLQSGAVQRYMSMLGAGAILLIVLWVVS